MSKSPYRTPMRYFDLIETFPKPGCAVCSLLLHDVERFVDLLMFEFDNSEEMRAVFSASRGVCGEHGEMLRQNKLGNVLGTAKLYRASLNEVLHILDHAQVESLPPSNLDRLRGRGAKSNNTPLADQLAPTETCVVCDVMDTYERDYIGIFCQYLGEERFQETFRQSEGLCLPHFRQALRQMTDPANAQVLIDIQRDIWSELLSELELFIEKQDYERRGEGFGKEGNSWIRAIRRMAGEKGVFGMHRTDKPPK
ncbi:MAG: DUF6062 family protein [Anaerolineae bacterium]|nr:DUF6062 family protein [Anaerolineae bacterium]